MIAALRARGGATDIYRLARDLDVTVRSAQRNLARLRKSGRVHRVRPRLEGVIDYHEPVLWVLVGDAPRQEATA
jgi:DNA-binding MarR family transcriptional regulator